VAFFFQPGPTSPRAPNPIEFDIASEKLLSAPSDGPDTHAQQFRDPCVSSVSELQAFETDIQSTLLLVEKAEEEDDRGLQFIRCVLP
jgi:hypothetical protein